ILPFEKIRSLAVSVPHKKSWPVERISRSYVLPTSRETVALIVRIPVIPFRLLTALVRCLSIVTVWSMVMLSEAIGVQPQEAPPGVYDHVPTVDQEPLVLE